MSLLLSSGGTVKPKTSRKTTDKKEYRPTTAEKFQGISKTLPTLSTQNQPNKELLTTDDIRGEPYIFKVLRKKLTEVPATFKLSIPHSDYSSI